MKTKNLFSKTILFLLTVAASITAYAQGPQMKHLSFPRQQLSFLPNATLSNLPNVIGNTPNEYDPDYNYKWANNRMYDKYDSLLFFIVDQYVYDRNGKLIDELTAQINNTTYYVKGYNEIVIIPFPGSCKKFYIISGTTIDDDICYNNL